MVSSHFDEYKKYSHEAKAGVALPEVIDRDDARRDEARCGFGETPTIVIDTREGEPYSFDPNIFVVRRALKAGDYSLLGMEDHVGVERKEISDFVNTVIHGRARFSVELKKLRVLEAACVVVEGNLSDILAGRYRGGAHPHSVFGAVISIIIDCGVPVFFCSDRQIARKFTQEYLLRFWRKARLESVKEAE